MKVRPHAQSSFESSRSSKLTKEPWYLFTIKTSHKQKSTCCQRWSDLAHLISRVLSSAGILSPSLFYLWVNQILQKL